MNRIYQGEVTAVEIPDGKDEQGKPLDQRRTVWAFDLGKGSIGATHSLHRTGRRWRRPDEMNFIPRYASPQNKTGGS